MGIPIIAEERFDTLSLARCIKNIGRAYQRQAIELVNLCRMFVETSPPGKRHNVMPKLAMLAIFEVLRLAEVAGKKVTDKASAAFQEAKVTLLRYRAIVHPGLQTMDAMIAERMTHAKEKDERSLELFNQIMERRGPNETSTLSDANGRLRMRHTDRQVDTEVQVAPSETSCASSASALTHVPSPTRAKVGERQHLLMDDEYPSGNPPSLTHCAPLASISQKWPTAGSCSTSTTTPVPPAPGASRSPETRTHRSPSTTVTPATGIQQSSFVIAGPGGNRPLIAQERPESTSLPPSDLPPHFPAPISSHPPPSSTHPDPPSNFLDVSPTVGSEHQNGTTQCSSSSLLQSTEKKVSPIHGQTKIKRPTRASITPMQSAKFAPFSIPPSLPGPLEARRKAPRSLMMPGAFPGTSLDDVDVESWVLVSPVGPDFQVEVSNGNWFKRMFSRFG